MSIRTDKIASSIRRVLQTHLARGLNDPRIAGLVSVTAVHVSPDLAEAVVEVSILPEDRSELTMHGLRHAAGHLQSQLAGALSLRRSPRLVFRLDRSIKKQAGLDAALAAARTPPPPVDPEDQD